MSKLRDFIITNNTTAKHTATVIFFHGSGSCGEHMRDWVKILQGKNFSFPHIRIIYPTAPLQPYTPAGRAYSHVWFDRADISQDVPEKIDSLKEIEVEIKKLIKNENDLGIPNNRIIVGGFSMGGALSLYTGYKWAPNLAGVFAFSSFLNDKSIVYQNLAHLDGAKLPPLLQIHGDLDELVDFNWGYRTFHELKTLGVKGEFVIMEHLGHSLNKRGLTKIKQWIEEHLPDV